MEQLRISHHRDLPRLRELWQLAFGDEEDYMDGFFHGYWQPERVLVLEEAGRVQAMTAWFDMPVVTGDGCRYPAAYLYAVATHPDCRGRGLAHKLLAFAGQWLAQRGFACLTTVPARPDLHPFFASNGFLEGYTLARAGLVPGAGPCAGLAEVEPEQYNALRRAFLSGRGYVDYSREAMAYQQGACRLSGGGLYRVDGAGCACVEMSGDTAFIKELLVDPERVAPAVNALAARHPAERYQLRTPWPGPGERVPFAMYRWLADGGEIGPDDYLGLAFD